MGSAGLTACDIRDTLVGLVTPALLPHFVRQRRGLYFKAFTMAMSLLNLQRLVAPRILPSIPSLTRSIVIRPEAPKRDPIPPPRDPSVFKTGLGPYARPAEAIKTPEDFLKAIGRSSETKLSPPSWEELWKMDGHAMKVAGVNVRDRRSVAIARTSREVH